jgi:hypothetical protein
MIGEKTPVTEVAQVLGVSRATLYRRGLIWVWRRAGESMLAEPFCGWASTAFSPATYPPSPSSSSRRWRDRNYLR